MPVEAPFTRRNMQFRLRACDGPDLFAFPTGNGATALPQILDEATYTPLATMKPGDQGALLANGIYGYMPAQEDKMVALEFCSAAAAENNTQVWEFGMYSRPNFLNRATPTYTGWLNIGTVNFTMTLGQRTLANQITDPYVNSQTITSATLRWADTYAETTNDFNNSTAGFYQFVPIGYGALNKSGHILVDCSFASLLCIRLVTKAASSTAEFVGVYSEIN